MNCTKCGECFYCCRCPFFSRRAKVLLGVLVVVLTIAAVVFSAYMDGLSENPPTIWKGLFQK